MNLQERKDKIKELAISLAPIAVGAAIAVGYFAHKNHWKIADWF